MKTALWIPLSALCLLLANSCAHKPEFAQDTSIGPFDENGNYIEEWANDPSKWKRPSGRTKPANSDLPLLAANDQPPPDANPLAPAVRNTPTSRATAQNSVRQTPRATSTSARSQTATVKPKPRPTAVAQVKPKPKPKPTRYTVRQGDNLWVIARRQGTTVNALKSANGISGTLLQPGQSLVIPRR